MILLGLGRKKKAGVPPEISAYFAKLGKEHGAAGGKATAAKRTAAERSESARKAVQARWARAKAKQDTEGRLTEEPPEELPEPESVTTTTTYNHHRGLVRDAPGY